jgi:ParB-like chromosome segregation protein Spo0J
MGEKGGEKMTDKKEAEVQRVFWPEFEKVFPSENQKTILGVCPLPEGSCSKDEEEDRETGECQKGIEDIKLIKTGDLKVSEPFCSLFPIDGNILSQILEDMKTHGYDCSQPVVVWKDKGIVIDGHTRVRVASMWRIKKIPVFEKEFADEEDALNYAVHCQVNRRNLTDADILRLVEKLDQRGKVGRPPVEITSNEVENMTSSQKLHLLVERLNYDTFKKEFRRSSKITATLLKTSASKIEKVRTVLDKGDEKIKAAVLAGEITINKAYVDTLKKPKPHILKFRGDGLQAILTINRNVGEIDWMILGSGKYPNFPVNSGDSKTLHLRSERFD